MLPSLIIAALFVRLSVVGHGGFGGDIHLNTRWAESAVRLGLAASYSQQIDSQVMLPNYPPLGMMIFAATGHVYRYLLSSDFNRPLFNIIIKIPAIIADLFAIIALFALLIPIKGRRWALAGASLYAFHPAVIHDSSIWGQTDGIFTLFLCLSILCVQRHQWFLTGVSIGAALLIKMQSVVLLPVVAVAAAFNPRRWFSVVTGSCVIFAGVFAPFLTGEALQKIVQVYLHSVGYYANVSSNAYNFWVMLYTRDTQKTATDQFLHLISYRNFGLAVWVTVIVTVLCAWWPSIRDDIRTKGAKGMLLLSAAVIAYAFFYFNAEMHERYLFPYMALALPLITTGKRGIILYLAASALFTLNLTSIVAFGEWDRWLVQDEWGKALPVAIATAHFFVFILTCTHIHAYQRTIKKVPAQKTLKRRLST